MVSLTGIEILELKDEIGVKEKDFLAKEKELNWLYETSMAEASGNIKEKEETLSRQGEELSALQEQLMRARESGMAVIFMMMTLTVTMMMPIIIIKLIMMKVLSGRHIQTLPARLHSWNYFFTSRDGVMAMMSMIIIHDDNYNDYDDNRDDSW